MTSFWGSYDTKNGAIATRILVSDRNIFLKKDAGISPRSGAHVGEIFFLLMTN